MSNYATKFGFYAPELLKSGKYPLPMFPLFKGLSMQEIEYLKLYQSLSEEQKPTSKFKSFYWDLISECSQSNIHYFINYDDFLMLIELSEKKFKEIKLVNIFYDDNDNLCLPYENFSIHISGKSDNQKTTTININTNSYDPNSFMMTGYVTFKNEYHLSYSNYRQINVEKIYDGGIFFSDDSEFFSDDSEIFEKIKNIDTKEKIKKILEKDINLSLSSVAFFLLILNTINLIDTKTVKGNNLQKTKESPKKIHKIVKSFNKGCDFTHKTLTIKTNVTKSTKPVYVRRIHGTALHDVRGHYRHYKNGKSIFIKSHKRGDVKYGEISKDYKIAL
jgi:hypothetical protein